MKCQSLFSWKDKKKYSKKKKKKKIPACYALIDSTICSRACGRGVASCYYHKKMCTFLRHGDMRISLILNMY